MVGNLTLEHGSQDLPSILLSDSSRLFVPSIPWRKLICILHGWRVMILMMGEIPFSWRGVIISTYPEPSMEDPRSMIMYSEINFFEPYFEVLVDGLESEKTYFYRAFAANEEGFAYGAVYRFKTKAIPAYPYWADAQPIQDAEGWWNSPWFGSFFINDDHRWILHAEFGWLFILPQERRILDVA